MSDITFLWPAALIGLVLVPLALLWYLLLQRRRDKYTVRFTILDLLANVAPRRPGVRRHLPALLALLALTALVLGVARPQAAIKVPKRQATLVLAMDTSASMTADDGEPTRLAAARSAARTLLESLPDQARVGVVGFAQYAATVSPVLSDKEAVLEAIDNTRPEGGTALGEAIDQALSMGHAATGNGATDPAGALMRLSVSSCAMISARGAEFPAPTCATPRPESGTPDAPIRSLPPTWSACGCVLMMYRTGRGVS